MKKLYLWAALAVLMASQATAQYFGLPVGDSAATNLWGMRRVEAMVSRITDGPVFYGVRGTYGLTDYFRIFGDLGKMTGLDESAEGVSEDFGGTAIQVGATYNVPTAPDFPYDVAIRGAIFKPFISGESTTVPIEGFGNVDASMDVSAIGGNIGGLISGNLDTILPGLTAYAGAGLYFLRTTVDWSCSADLGFGLGGGSSNGSESDMQTELGVIAGAIYEIDNNFSVYAELGHVDGTVLGTGLRYTF